MKASRLISLLAIALAGAVVFPVNGSSADPDENAPTYRAGKGGSAQIYFFARPSSPVGGTGFRVHNPLVVRPKGMPLFEDGQWVLEKLKWSGWGSPVAKARGRSSSSTGNPNAAEGDRIVTWARVRLSQPGIFRGHRVYRCLRISVPPPASYPPRCLQRQHHASASPRREAANR